MNPIIICDLDGTLFDATHRLHFIEQTPKDWKSFFEATDKDTVHDFCLVLIEAMEVAGYEVVFVTGRPESSRKATYDQLKKIHFHENRLIMRPNGDHTDEHLLKPRLRLENLRTRSILFALEDRARVARALRDIDIRVLQVAEGDF